MNKKYKLSKTFFELYKSGLKIKDIARKFNCTPQNVSQHLRADFPEYNRTLGLFSRNLLLEIECPICKNVFIQKKALSRVKTCSIKCGGIYRRKFDVPINKLPIQEFRKYKREARRKYYAGKGKDIIKRIAREQREKYKNKAIARWKLNQAVGLGKIKKPSKCSNCKQLKLRVCGHHPNYLKPLEVIWLCDVCHKKEHVKIRK